MQHSQCLPPIQRFGALRQCPGCRSAPRRPQGSLPPPQRRCPPAWPWLAGGAGVRVSARRRPGVLWSGNCCCCHSASRCAEQSSGGGRKVPLRIKRGTALPVDARPIQRNVCARPLRLTAPRQPKRAQWLPQLPAAKSASAWAGPGRQRAAQQPEGLVQRMLP